MIKRKDQVVAGFTEGATPFEALDPEVGSVAAPLSMTATDAKNRFGELLELARREPVHVQKNGRTVAVCISPEEYRRLVEGAAAPKVRPLVDELLERSIVRRRSLYEALAK